MFSENKLEGFSKKISKLDDRPQMSAQTLKEYFDSSAEELRVKFNALIDALDAFGAASFESVSYNGVNGKLAFTFGNGDIQEIDLPLELLVESGHYDADAQSIVLTLANSDVITIPVSDLIDEYEADEKTLHMTASETSRIFSVKDGVFASEAPSDSKSYLRKDGAWEPYTAPEGDGETIVTDAEGKVSVKDGVFAPEAPADGVLYARKDGGWTAVSAAEQDGDYGLVKLSKRSKGLEINEDGELQLFSATKALVNSNSTNLAVVRPAYMADAVARSTHQQMSDSYKVANRDISDNSDIKGYEEKLPASYAAVKNYVDSVKGLPHITLSEADGIADGLYIVDDAFADWAIGMSENPLTYALLISGRELYGEEYENSDAHQMLILPCGELWRRTDAGEWQSVIPSLAEVNAKIEALEAAISELTEG